MSTVNEQVFTHATDDGFDVDPDYRALSSSAVCGAMLGLLSILAFLNWTMLVVPVLGLLVSLKALATLRANPRELTGGWLAWIGVIVSAVCLLGGSALHAVVYATELPEGYSRLYYEELQPDAKTSAAPIPRSALELEGKRVMIKGFMYPGAKTSGIRQFTLVRDKGTCCFGGDPKITDRVLVRLRDEQGAEFSTGEFKVAGVFHIKQQAAVDAGGGVLYELDEAFLR